MKLVHCKICKGQKQVRGLGNMINDCKHCKAVGWIEVEIKSCCDEPQEIMDLPKPRKKPGRKLKVENVLHV